MQSDNGNLMRNSLICNCYCYFSN